jgi:hypothetical protein
MNNLLRRVLDEKRSLVLTLVVALVANMAVYALVVRPRGLKAAGAADRAAAAAGAVRAGELELAAARALVEGKRRADEELNAFYQRVLPADLSAARRMTYASLPALARRTNVRYEQRRSGVDERNDEGRLVRFTIRMVLQCEYASFRNFIFQLESAPEFVIIDDVTLTESSANEPLTLTIDLSTYFRLRPRGA